MEKQARKRLAAVTELITTEETYVNILNHVVTNFMDPLKPESCDILTRNDYLHIFPPDVRLLLKFHQRLLKDLRESFSGFNNNSTKIADLIISFCPCLKTYDRYYLNHGRAALALDSLKQNERWKEHCLAQRCKCKGLNLESVLINPIQRIPRYPLLLKEIIKQTPKSHPDRKKLEEAKLATESVTKEINACIDEVERYDQMLLLEAKFGGEVSFNIPGRRLEKKGPLAKRSGKQIKRNKNYEFFLFNDQMIYASRSGKKYKLHQVLPVNDMFLISGIEEEGKALKVRSDVKSFDAQTKSAMEKQGWLRAFERVQTQWKNRKKNPEKAVGFVKPSDRSPCNHCKMQYSMTRTRELCKFCGKEVCSECMRDPHMPKAVGDFGKNGNFATYACPRCVGIMCH